MQDRQTRMPYALRSFVVCCALTLTGKGALSADFQLKGLTLGMDESAACGSAEVTDLQKTIDASSVAGIAMPASKCDVQVDSIAGFAPDGPLHLMFWKGRLVRVSARFEGMELNAALSINAAIVQTYGKPNSHKKGPANSLLETWRNGTQRLEVESATGNGKYIGIFLSDSVGWAEFERVEERVQKELAKQANQRQRGDLVN